MAAVIDKNTAARSLRIAGPAATHIGAATECNLSQDHLSHDAIFDQFPSLGYIFNKSKLGSHGQIASSFFCCLYHPARTDRVNGKRLFTEHVCAVLQCKDGDLRMGYRRRTDNDDVRTN